MSYRPAITLIPFDSAASLNVAVAVSLKSLVVETLSGTGASNETPDQPAGPSTSTSTVEVPVTQPGEPVEAVVRLMAVATVPLPD